MTVHYIVYKRTKAFWSEFSKKKMVFVMEFKRDRVISLYLAGKPQAAIAKALQHLNVNKTFVSRNIARYRDPGSVVRRQGSGRKKKAT